MRVALLNELYADVVSVFEKPSPAPNVIGWIYAPPPVSPAIARSTVFVLQQ